MLFAITMLHVAPAFAEFVAPVSYPAGAYPQAGTIADVDGDGDLDVAASNWNSADVSVFLNNGDGSFAAAVNYAAGVNPQDVAIASPARAASCARKAACGANTPW